MDESHKLPEVAREMFGVTLSAEDIQSTIYALKMERYLLAAEYLADAAEPLLALLTQPPEERPFSEYAHLLLIPYQVLKTIQKQLCKKPEPPVPQKSGQVDLYDLHTPSLRSGGQSGVLRN